MNIAPEKNFDLALKYPFEGLSIGVIPGACFAKVPVTFRAQKTAELCFCSFYNNFENNKIKHWQSVQEALGIVLLFRQEVRILKVAFGLEKSFWGFQEMNPWPIKVSVEPERGMRNCGNFYSRRWFYGLLLSMIIAEYK